MSMPTLPELFANVRGVIVTDRVIRMQPAYCEIQIRAKHIRIYGEPDYNILIPLDTPYEVNGSILTFEGETWQFELLMNFVDFTGKHMAPEEPESVAAVVFYLPPLSPEKLEKYMDKIRIIHNEASPGKPLSLLGLIGGGWIYKIIPDRNGAGIAADEFEEKVIELVGKTYAKHLMARAYNPHVYNLSATTVQFLSMKPAAHKHYYNPKRLCCAGPTG